MSDANHITDASSEPPVHEGIREGGGNAFSSEKKWHVCNKGGVKSSSSCAKLRSQIWADELWRCFPGRNNTQAIFLSSKPVRKIETLPFAAGRTKICRLQARSTSAMVLPSLSPLLQPKAIGGPLVSPSSLEKIVETFIDTFIDVHSRSQTFIDVHSRSQHVVFFTCSGPLPPLWHFASICAGDPERERQHGNSNALQASASNHLLLAQLSPPSLHLLKGAPEHRGPKAQHDGAWPEAPEQGADASNVHLLHQNRRERVALRGGRGDPRLEKAVPHVQRIGQDGRDDSCPKADDRRVQLRLLPLANSPV
eukprot:scaffold462_cov195-Pinguiococcus_pyrenoidosus.AAC.10